LIIIINPSVKLRTFMVLIVWEAKISLRTLLSRRDNYPRYLLSLSYK
jgi:hypothetical protein